MKKSNVSTTTEQENQHTIEQIVKMLHQHQGELEAIYAGLPSSDPQAKDIDGLLWHLAIDTKDNRDEEIHTRVAGFLRNGGTIDVMQQSIDHAKRTLPPPSANVKQKSDNSKHKLRDIKHDVLPTATNSRQTLQNQNATSEIEELQLVEQHLTELMGAGQQTLRQRFHHLAEDKQGLQRDTVSEQLAELLLIRDEILFDDGSHGEFQQHINAIQENCLPPNQLARQASPIEEALATAITTLERALIYVHAPTTHWRSKNRALHILYALTDSYKAEQQIFVRLASNPNTHEQYQQVVAAYADLVNVAILGGNRYLLPAPIARKLLCINQYGELEKSNETGQHAVCSAKGIHYKPQQRESTPDDPDISPGKEYAIGSLLQLIAGEQLVAAPTMLLDIQKVPIESKQGTFVPRFLQAGLTIDGILLRDYLFLQDGLNIWGKQIGSQPLANIVDDAHQGFKDSIKSVQEAFPDLLGAYQAFCQHQQGKQALSTHENATQYRVKKLNLVRELYSAFQAIIKASNAPNLHDDSDDLYRFNQVEASLSTIDDRCNKIRQGASAKNDKHAVKEIEETNSQLYQQTLDCYGIVKEWMERYLGNHEKKVHEKSGDSANPFLNLLGILKQHPTLIGLGHPVSLLVDHINTFHYVLKLFPNLPSWERLSPTEHAIQESKLLLTKKYLDQDALGALWLGQLLGLPTDAKSDNFMLALTYHTPTQIKIESHGTKHQQPKLPVKQSSTSNLYRCRLVSIDNDFGLTMPFEQRGENFILRHTKNILLSIPEVRECILSTRVRENFLAVPAKQQWLTWLSIVARRDIHFTHWMNQSAVSTLPNKQHTSIDLPVSFDQSVIEFILDRWQTLQKYIENTPKATLLELTHYLYPTVAFLYEERLEKEKIKCAEVHEGRPLVAEDKHAEIRRTITPNDSSDYIKSAQAQSQQEQKCILAQHFLYSDILLKLQWHTMTSSEQWVYLSSLALLPQLIKSSWIEQEQHSKDTDAITLALQHSLQHAIRTARPLMAYQLLKLGAQLDKPPDVMFGSGEDAYYQKIDNHLDLFCASVGQGSYYTSHEQVNLMVLVLFSQAQHIINNYNSQGYTPLQQYVNQAIDLSVMPPQKRQMMLTLLDKFIAHGANLEAKDSYKHETILDKVCKLSARPLKIDWFIALIERGAGTHANPDKIMAFINEWPRAVVQRHLELLGLLSKRNLGLTWKLSQTIWRQSTAIFNKKAIRVKGIGTKETVLFKAAQTQLANAIKQSSATHAAGEEDTSAYGRRVVKCIKTNIDIDKAVSKSNSALIPCAVDWYFKLYPEMPGVEIAVATFGDMLFGPHTAPHELLALDTHKILCPALASQTVPGENLQTVLNTLIQADLPPSKLDQHQEEVAKAKKMLESLHPRYLSEQIILAMLLNLEDGKPDNFQLMKVLDNSEKIAGNPYYWPVGIDNDHAFVQTAKLSKDKATLGEVELQVKNVLFCFDQMRKPIDSAVRARILSITLDDNQQRHEKSFLQQWLENSTLKQYEATMPELFNEAIRKQLFERGIERWSDMWQFGKWRKLRKAYPVVLQIPFHQDMISGLYRRFARLKALLTTYPAITHLRLLEELEPVAGVFYRGAFQQYPQPLKIFERFHTVAAQSYEQLAHNQLGTITTSKVVLEESGLSDEKVEAIYKDSTVSEMSLQQAIETLRKTVASYQYEALLSEKLANGNEEDLEAFLNQHQSDKLQSWFMQLTTLKIKFNQSNTADKKRQERIIDIILNVNANSHIQKLHLENCMTLTDKQLEQLLKNLPMLTKLTVMNCSALTSAMFNSMCEHLNVLESIRISQLLIEEMDVSSEFVRLERCDISHNPALKKIDVIAPVLRKARIHENRALMQVELTSERLSLLNLSLNPAMTDQAVIDAVKSHPLMSLNLYGSQHANSILPTVLFQENSILAVPGILTGAENWLAQFEQCLNDAIVTLDIDTLQTNLVLQEAIKRVLENNSTINTLNINVIELTAELLDLLIAGSKKHQAVCNIQLSYQMTHLDDLASKLRALFAENPRLVINGHTAQSVQDFEKSYIEDDQCNSIITFKKDTLTNIDLSLLLQSIYNKSFETITIQYQQLPDSHNLATGLHAIIQAQPNLRSLMVNGVEHIELISLVAQQSCDLWKMKLQLFEQELIVNTLKANYYLTHLNLSVTGIDDKMAQSIAGSLNASNGLRNSLVKLNVSSNKITNDGAQYLMEGLQHNNTLTDLNLSYNQIDNFSRSTIINPVFNYNHTLLSINLEGNRIREPFIGKSQIDELSEKLERNQQLAKSTLEALHAGEVTTVIKQCKQGVSPYAEFPPQLQPSLLHMTAKLGQLAVMQYFLLHYTLCLASKNEAERTPLDEAINAGQFAMAELLQHPQKCSYLTQAHTTMFSKVNIFPENQQARDKSRLPYDKRSDLHKAPLRSFTEQFGELNNDRLHTLSNSWQTTLQNIHGELTISDVNDVPIATSWMNDAQIKRLLFDCFSLSDGPDKTGGIYYISHMNKSPCDSDIAIANEVAFEYAKQICGYYSNQGEQEESHPGLVSLGNELDKPVVMIWNTETVLAEQSSQINKSGGSHWQTCVILPKNYRPYYGEPLENDTELVYFVDSKYAERTMPNSLKQMLTSDDESGEGRAYEFSVDGKKYSHRIAKPFCIQEEHFTTCRANQQRDDNDCGYWAVYNAIMLVCTGRDDYLKQFSERRYANTLRCYFDRIIADDELLEDYKVQGMGSMLTNSISSLFTTSCINPMLESTKKSVLKTAAGLSTLQRRRQNELTKACAAADLERVKQLVAQGASLVMPDETGQQPLAATLWALAFNVLRYLEENVSYTNEDWQCVAAWIQERHQRIIPAFEEFTPRFIPAVNSYVKGNSAFRKTVVNTHEAALMYRNFDFKLDRHEIHEDSAFEQLSTYITETHVMKQALLWEEVMQTLACNCSEQNLWIMHMQAPAEVPERQGRWEIIHKDDVHKLRSHNPGIHTDVPTLKNSAVEQNLCKANIKAYRPT